MAISNCSRPSRAAAGAKATRDKGSRLSLETPAESNVESITLLNDAGVAELLGIHKRSLWRLVSTGHFPEPVRFGARFTRWRLSQVREFVESQHDGLNRREVRR